jgi:hypothetical protein
MFERQGRMDKKSREPNQPAESSDRGVDLRGGASQPFSRNAVSTSWWEPLTVRIIKNLMSALILFMLVFNGAHFLSCLSSIVVA